MSKLYINDSIMLKLSAAKWHLDHPEVYQRPNGEMDDYYENETLLHLVMAMGEPVVGTVIGYGGDSDTYHVAFEAGGIKMAYYAERNHLIKVKK